MNIPQKILNIEASSLLHDANELDLIFSIINRDWKDKHTENACALHRDSLSGIWHRQVLIREISQLSRSM